MSVNWEGDCGSSLLFSSELPNIKPDLTGRPFSGRRFCPAITPLKSVAVSVAASVLGHKQRAAPWQYQAYNSLEPYIRWLVIIMSRSLFTPAELEEIHAQIAQLRADTMRISAQTSPTVCVPLFVPHVHFLQTITLAFCLVATVGTITAAVIKFLL